MEACHEVDPLEIHSLAFLHDVRSFRMRQETRERSEYRLDRVRVSGWSSARDRPLVSPEVEILTPVAGFKIHREDTLTVRVRMKIVPGSRLPSLLTITYESREKNRVHGHIVPQCAGTVLIQQVRNEGDGYVCEGVLPSPAMNWKGRWIDVTIGIVDTEIVWMPSGPAKITNTDWDSKPVVIEIIDK